MYLCGSSDVFFFFLHFERTRDGVIGYIDSDFMEILIKEDLLLDMCLLLEVVLSVGKLLCRLQLRC